MDINKALEQLADGFNTTVDNLYPILYRQAMIEGVMNLFWVLLLAGLIVTFVWYVKFVQRKQKKDWSPGDWDWDEARVVFPVAFGILITAISVIAIPILIQESITAFFNTEYYMIEKVLDKVRGGD